MTTTTAQIQKHAAQIRQATERALIVLHDHDMSVAQFIRSAAPGRRAMELHHSLPLGTLEMAWIDLARQNLRRGVELLDDAMGTLLKHAELAEPELVREMLRMPTFGVTPFDWARP